MAEAPPPLPDLSQLLRTNLVDRLLNLSFGGRGVFPEPTGFQLTTAARLLDKSLTAWELTTSEFAQHAETREGIPEELQPPEPGVSRAFFRAIDHLETLIDSLDRLLRLVDRLEAAPDLATLAGKPLPSAEERERVRGFRNRIAHGDEDIEDGKAGPGIATATLLPDTTGVELQNVRLAYSELGRMLKELHDYLRAAMALLPDR